MRTALPPATARKLQVRPQRGAALLVAMLTVTLAASFAASALWQQWRAVEIEAAERTRMQSSWLLTGALDWARLILREDAASGNADHLAEPWALPLQEARLSNFLALDKTNVPAENQAPQLEVFLSGRIEDMQARLNVANLLEGSAISEPDLLIFTRLFDLLGLPQQELTQMAANLARARSRSAEQPAAHLVPQRLEQLEWLGLSEATIARLRPYVTLLPTRTALNLNTASVETIAATITGLELSDAAKMVQDRSASHFRSLDDARRSLGEKKGNVLNSYRHSVDSRFFEVSGKLRTGDSVLEERSVLRREGQTVSTVWRDRRSL